jgi:hypothetical protein
MNGAVPAASQDLRQATGIIAVCFVAHGRQGRGGLARLEADDFEASLLQTIRQILGESASFQSDLPDVGAEASQCRHDEIHLGRHLGLVLHCTGLIDHADRHETQRHINSGEVPHRALSFTG